MSFKGTVRATRPTDWKRYGGNLNDEITGNSSQLTGGAPSGTFAAGGVTGDRQSGSFHVTGGAFQYASSWVINNQAAFTLGLLFKTDNPGAWSGGGLSILASGDANGEANGGTFIGSFLGINNSGQMQFSYGRPNTTNHFSVASTGGVGDGNWHMAFLTSDGANSPLLASYLDGVLVDSTTLAATLVRLGNNFYASSYDVGAYAPTNGAGINNLSHPVYFGECILWNRPLSAGEVAMLWDEVSRGYAPGTYQEPLAPRYNYDQDGTVVRYTDANGNITTLTSGQVQNLVDEDPTSFSIAANMNGFGTNHIDLIFPIAMDLYDVNYYGVFGLSGGTAFGSIQQSPDGTTFSAVPSGLVNTSQRTYAMTTALPASNVKALRFNFSTPGSTSSPVYFGLLHLYGLPYITAAPQAVTLWHPTADTPLPGGGVDFGDVGPTTQRDRQFRLKNLHGSLTASGTLLTLAALTDVSPSLTTEYQFSVGGGSFGSTASVGNISPGALSPVITMRRIGASGAPSGLHAIQVDIAATFV